MEVADVTRLAEQLLVEHALTGAGWTFAFDDARTRRGSCDFDRRRITLSRTLAEAATPEQVTQTLLHEVAHALTGPGTGHSLAWRLKARQIGYTGGRLIPSAHSRAQGVDEPARGGRSQPGLRAGDQVILPDGRPGTLRVVGRTRYHIEDGDGQWWSVAFAGIRSAGSGIALTDTPPADVPATRPTPLPVGSRIRVTGGPTRHRGKTGVILAHGPATYRVRCDGNGEHLRVPHRLAAHM